jgi:alpha-amylase/alpha-mannosidase (GH57 family)
MSNFSGHGSAMAMAYNHMIMPLANSRDKRTQVLWGIADFVSRFRRRPEGMWLPETAVDLATLDIMAGEGIKFTILAPHQASSFRELPEGEWIETEGSSIDIKKPYLCRLPSGRFICIFFYERGISNDVAFSNLLSNGEELVRRIIGAFSEEHQGDQLVSIATDGETYGHHHKFGEMALSYCLYKIGEGGIARLTNYGERLALQAPQHEVKIRENSSWSCPHGIERWRDDCGCRVGVAAFTGWRKPLRTAMDWLRDSAASIYQEKASQYLVDPWQVRDDYISVILDRSKENVEAFLARHSLIPLSSEEQTTVLRLLEVQRNALLMYTSCGWYFDDISGIETMQILSYAARVIQLVSQVSGIDLEPGYLERLRGARSDNGEMPTGEEIYLKFIKPKVIDITTEGV